MRHAARALGRPVKGTDTRSESFLSDHHGRGVQVTAELALDIISHYAEQNPTLDLSGIISTVCKAYGITQAQLQSKSRKADFVTARNSVFYLARKHTEHSLQEIGGSLNRAHTTVIKGISALEREINRQSPKGLQISNTLALIEKNAAGH